MPAPFSHKCKYVDAVKVMGRGSNKGLEAGAPLAGIALVPPCYSLTPLLKGFSASKLQA